MFTKWILKILAILSLWGTWAVIILKIDPDMVSSIGWSESYLPFYVSLIAACLYTVSVVSKSLLKGVVITLYVVSQLYMMQIRIMTPLILVASSLGVIFLLWYLSRKNGKVDERSTFNNESEEKDEEH